MTRSCTPRPAPNQSSATVVAFSGLSTLTRHRQQVPEHLLDGHVGPVPVGGEDRHPGGRFDLAGHAHADAEHLARVRHDGFCGCSRRSLITSQGSERSVRVRPWRDRRTRAVSKASTWTYVSATSTPIRTPRLGPDPQAGSWPAAVGLLASGFDQHPDADQLGHHVRDRGEAEPGERGQFAAGSACRGCIYRGAPRTGWCCGCPAPSVGELVASAPHDPARPSSGRAPGLAGQRMAAPPLPPDARIRVTSVKFQRSNGKSSDFATLRASPFDKPKKKGLGCRSMCWDAA